MALRPASATWFELLTPREQLELALRCLAGTREVELQAHTDLKATHLIPRLRAAVDEYRRLAQAYGQYWPAPSHHPMNRERELEVIPQEALARLRTWAAQADPLIAQLQQLANERANLELLERLLRSDAALPDLALLGRAGPLLASRAYLLAPATGTLEIPPSVLAYTVESKDLSCLLAVGPRSGIEALDESLSARKARRLELPAQLPASRTAALDKVMARKEEIATTSKELIGQLEQVSRPQQVGEALADLDFAGWLLEHVPELAVTERFGWITGWTSAPSGERLEAALQRAHVQHVLRFPQPPTGLIRPVVLRNPRWAQPFELFERLLGIPGSSEADPSVILALIAPLLFGFMFADLGQGAVLLVAGAALKGRYPALALLIPGGLAAMLFGALFGSVFAREDLMAALWLRPLEHPLVPLAASLAFGACVLLLGLALDAIQHAWAGHARLWWSTRAGLVLCYLGMIACAFDLRALWVVPLGLAWFWIGSGWVAPAARLQSFLTSIGESIEVLLQLFVNTLSFVRVGAFALAHAGLAAAINALTAGVGSLWAVVLLLALGNLAVIVIEGLIVGIQTTRLVLFEFFIRFLRGSGRPLRPLPPPLSESSASRGSSEAT
jgi:V/A-type H+-transporting ATPase subunit I